MRGTVTWLHASQRRGVIVGENKTGYHFAIEDVYNRWMPARGASVTFMPDVVNRRSVARQVRPVGSSDHSSGDDRHPDMTACDDGRASHDRNDRIACRSCGRQMVPRIIVKQGTPYKSLCPFCGATHQTFAGAKVEKVVIVVMVVLFSVLILSFINR